MRRPAFALLALPLIAACSAQEPGDPPAGTPSPTETLASATWQPPESCPGWADADRPSGSNCYGILPERCGADRAVVYVGQAITTDIKTVLQGIAPDGIRVIGPDDAITDDLREGRLNVSTDADGVITKVDCY
ncbi:I78 family peptidase inhibitor [Croceicoccus naphthovorans]|uniref:I78 family peptidase inhibitor n=1 Tax=Croceicoccus naphthovorans TaxID=1348774 RepID=UPI00069D890A|nr:I78 family peptidase inhibitor [Croceicoccus naphthovorans]MBB3990698.1 hypothetical protein [Croceicoccus naphthovorans]